MNDAEIIELATRVGARLLERGWTLTTAESCTGGLVAGAITEVAGSSAWFERGFVTYSNAAKEQMLGVPVALLRQFGAVSEPVAGAMADGALAAAKAGIAVAVTGIAGPSGGTADKPVGMVCFGWAQREAPTGTTTVQFSGDRATIRARALRHALEGILIRLDGRAQGV